MAKIWGYFPVDSTGPGDRLSTMARETLLGLDRILVTSPWAEVVMRRTLGDQACAQRGLSWMPHPVNMEVFNDSLRDTGNHNADISISRDSRSGIRSNTQIGCVATNQIRK